MKKTKLLAIVIAIIALFCSCSHAPYISDLKAVDQANYASKSDFEAVDQANYARGNAIESTGYVAGNANVIEETQSNENLTENKKNIRNAKIDVEVIDAKSAYNIILDWAKGNGGYEFTQTLSVSDGYNVINAKIKIPPQKLDEFIAFIGENGDVINSNLFAEDITDSYFDVGVRLETKRSSLAAYYNMLGTAKTVDEILSIQRTIDDITADIESLQGKLNLWDKQIAESTVTLNMREKNDPVKIKKEINWRALSLRDMGILIRYGFMFVWNGIVAAVQYLIILVISVLPLIVIGAVILFLICRKKRGKK